VRPERQAPDAATPTPSHRAPASGRHTGTRARPTERSRLPRNAALGAAAVALTAATAFWLQDLRAPTAGREAPSAADRAAAARDTSDTSGTGTDSTGTGTADGGVTPSVAPAPGALPSDAPSTGPTAVTGVDPAQGTGGVATAVPGADAVSPAPALPSSDRSALVAAATGPDRSPAALRSALEQVMSARATATTALLRTVVTGELDDAATAAAAVDATSNELEAVLAAWGQADGAAQLREAFDLQVVASRGYASAVKDDDDPAADQARAEMGATSRVLGTMLEQLTTGAITRFVPPEDAARMRDVVDAHAAGDPATAADVEAWLTARAGREGVALATALAGPA
jgi:hypothetical protein